MYDGEHPICHWFCRFKMFPKNVYVRKSFLLGMYYVGEHYILPVTVFPFLIIMQLTYDKSIRVVIAWGWLKICGRMRRLPPPVPMPRSPLQPLPAGHLWPCYKGTHAHQQGPSRSHPAVSPRLQWKPVVPAIQSGTYWLCFCEELVLVHQTAIMEGKTICFRLRLPKKVKKSIY